METSYFTDLFASFEDLNVLIIGDVMVDAYIWGRVNRISPEAPVPVVEVEKRENRLGGAANVALNVKALGANPVLCSVTGNDVKGKEFMNLLEHEGMERSGIVQSPDRITTTKYRIIGNKMQLLRVDEELASPITKNESLSLLERIRKSFQQFKPDVIILQDYDKGVITEEVISEVILMAAENEIPVTVDPKRKNFSAYKNVSLFKPNLKEISEGLNMEMKPDDKNQLELASTELRKMLNPEIILITLSEKGIFVDYFDNEERKSSVLPTVVRSVSDVSGAGDTVISVASLCIARKIEPERMAYISNIAGGQVCEQVGVVPVNKSQLLSEILTAAPRDPQQRV